MGPQVCPLTGYTAVWEKAECCVPVLLSPPRRGDKGWEEGNRTQSAALKNQNLSRLSVPISCTSVQWQLIIIKICIKLWGAGVSKIEDETATRDPDPKHLVKWWRFWEVQKPRRTNGFPNLSTGCAFLALPSVPSIVFFPFSGTCQTSQDLSRQECRTSSQALLLRRACPQSFASLSIKRNNAFPCWWPFQTFPCLSPKSKGTQG